MGCVYLVENTINRKCYVGKTVGSLEQRKCVHQVNSKQHKPKLFFHRALQKYSFKEFEWIKIYESKNNNKLIEREIYFIKKYKTKFPNGYNLTDGGEGPVGHKHSQQAIKKMSIAAIGNKNAKGAIRSKEYLEKQRKAQTGRHHSELTKLKMSIMRRGIPKTKEQNEKNRLGQLRRLPASKETKRKLSESLMGHNVSEETRRKLRRTSTGKHHSKKSKIKMSLYHKRMWQNPLYRDMMSEAHKGKSSGMLGKHCSEETKRKLSKAVKKYWTNKKNESN